MENIKKNNGLTGPIIRENYTLDEHFNRLGEGRTFFVRTYGCQANVRDGETITGFMLNMGFKQAEDEMSADVIFFNTCAIRKAAEDHVFGEIGHIKHQSLNSDKIIAVCGCMAQEESVIQEIKAKYPQVDLVFGTHNIARLPYLLEQVINSQERVIEVEAIPGNVIEGLPVERSNSYKAFINIMYGCNKFCTYCIVPYTRGRERSRYKEDIIQEVIDFKKAGGKEVILLGQNVNAYGKDLGEKDGFTDLLSACAETGIERIRFYTSHPRDYSVTTIEAMKKYPNIMKSLHLPVQSGSNEILKKMNRGYTVESYKALFDDMKKRIPEITFTTDLIVGFPGETDEQFKQTLDLVDYCKYDLAYSFVFSPREGTPAAKMEDNISQQEKKERLHILNEHIGMHANENNQKYVGKVLKVLCEGPSKKNKDVLTGYSEENKLVNFTGKGVLAGDIVRVKIINAKSYSLDGELVKE